jgi:hypothetical protein
MDVDTFTMYEIVVPETNEQILTRERYEALAYWKDTCMVFEHHVTVHNPTSCLQTRLTITRRWHNNPDFREED